MSSVGSLTICERKRGRALCRIPQCDYPRCERHFCTYVNEPYIANLTHRQRPVSSCNYAFDSEPLSIAVGYCPRGDCVGAGIDPGRLWVGRFVDAVSGCQHVASADYGPSACSKEFVYFNHEWPVSVDSGMTADDL